MDDSLSAQPTVAVQWARRVVAGLVLAEAGLLIVAAGFVLVALFGAAPDRRAADVTLVLIALVAGAGLAAVGRGVWAGRAWSRSPVLVWQLVQAATSASSATPGGWALRLPLLVAAVLAGMGVLIPGVVEAKR